MVWPSQTPRGLPSEVPESLRSLYAEASICEAAGSMRGAAGLYRAVVEVLAGDQGARTGSLYDKIEALRGRDVDVDIIDSLHEARLLGNWSLHDAVEFSPEEVEDVALLIADAIDQLYVLPAARSAMKAARAARRSSSLSPRSAST